jgi:hypothetical protein
MQFVIAALLGGLAMSASSLVGRVLLALGLSYVTYSGFDLAVTWLLNEIKANFSGMPVDVIQFLAWLWVDKAIGMLFAAYAASIAIKAAGSTTITKMVRK